MPKVGINLSEEINQRLKELTIKRTGNLRGQSEIVEAALKEYLDKNMIGEQDATCSA